MDPCVVLRDVQAAAERIKPYVHRTPVATCTTLDRMASFGNVRIKLFMKCENLQKVGAFKIRGATNAILSLVEKSPNVASSLTVITHSSGNHAQALAYAARATGVVCHVIMPSNSTSVKKDAVNGYGAIVTECAPTLQARESCTTEVIEKLRNTGRNVEFIPPYDDVRIVAGQGTLAVELLAQTKEMGYPLDILITPVGGGGMLSGCAVAAKGLDPNIRVVGAEPAAADDAYRSFYSKAFVPATNSDTVADGLRTSLGQINFRLILQHVDAIYTVTEVQIIQAMKLVYERMKLVIEPSSAVTLAVVLFSQEFKKCLEEIAQSKNNGKSKEVCIGLVFSGGNVDFSRLSSLFELV